MRGTWGRVAQPVKQTNASAVSTCLISILLCQRLAHVQKIRENFLSHAADCWRNPSFVLLPVVRLLILIHPLNASDINQSHLRRAENFHSRQRIDHALKIGAPIFNRMDPNVR